MKWTVRKKQNGEQVRGIVLSGLHSPYPLPTFLQSKGSVLHYSPLFHSSGQLGKAAIAQTLHSGFLSLNLLYNLSCKSVIRTGRHRFQPPRASWIILSLVFLLLTLEKGDPLPSSVWKLQRYPSF